MWNGISRDGQPLSMTGEQMADWAMRNEQHISVAWAGKKEFGDDEVTDPLLKGARFVKLCGREQTFAEAAQRAGWLDLAAKFAEAGL